MHPRTFLHRSPDGPRAQGLDTGALHSSHPLGFADVRSTEIPEPLHRRGPLGFGFTPAEATFVTELSFRRTTAWERPSARGTFDGPEATAPEVGHAEVFEPQTAGDPGTEIPVSEAKVPFYKRELSLRKKKPEVVETTDDDVAENLDDVEQADVVKRLIGFEPVSNGATEVADEAVEDEAVEVAAAADADLVDEPVEEHDGADTDALEVLAALDSADEPELDEVEAHEPDSTSHDEPVEILAHADEPETDVEHIEDTAENVAPDEVEKPSTGKRGSVMARRGGPKPAPRSGGGKGKRGGRRVVGLKLGASQIAAAVIVQGEAGSELVQLARRPLEDGVIVDGEVRDSEALRIALKEFFEEHKLPRKDIRVGVASNRVGVRTFDIVGIDDHVRFDNAVRFKAHEVLPVSVSESVLDYRVIDERVTETGETIKRVLLVVAPRDQVVPFVDVCQESGLSLAGIDLEALALLRTFVDPQSFALRSTSDTATVVVAIGHESSTLLVAGAGAAEFTRVFDWGGGALREAIEQALEVPAAEAASILKGLSLSGPGKGDLDEALRARALDAVRSRLTPFARELVASLQFYQAQTDSLGIGEIVITGGTSHLEGLAGALNQMIGVSVRVGDPLSRIIVRTQIDPTVEGTLGSLAVPIGLAIEDEASRSVNLLPQDFRRQGRKRPSALAIAAPLVAVVPLVALGFMYTQANSDASDQQSQLSAVQAQIAALPEPTRPTIDPALATQQAARATALASVLGGRVAWERMFGDVSRVLPSEVSLVRISATAPAPAPQTAATGVTAAPLPTTVQAVEVEGYAFHHDVVAQLLSRMETIPSLANVELVSSASEDLNGKPIVRFTIHANLNQSGGS